MKPLALFLLLSVALLAADDKPAPAPVTTVAEMPSPAGPRAMGAALTTAPDGTLWLSWIAPAAQSMPPASSLAPAPLNQLFFSTFDAAAKTWSPARLVATRNDLTLNSADFAQLVIDGRGTATAVWTDGKGGALFTTSTDRGETWSAPAPWTRDSDGVEKFTFVRLADGRVLAAWLDARGRKTGAKAQQLYTRILGDPAPDTLVDPSVCDCCPTSLTAFPDGGALVAYRGRTEEEVRDIRTSRFRGKAWDEPRPLNNDDWRLNACPMNAARLASDGGRVAVAWFTAAGNDPRVLASYSPDAGARFLLPLRLDRGKPAGQVGTLILRDGAMLVTWLEADGGFWLRRITPDFATEEPTALLPAGKISPRTNPRIALVRDYAGGTSSAQFVAAFNSGNSVKTLLVTVPEGELLTAKGNCDCAPTAEQLMGYAMRGAVAAVSTERGTLQIVHEELPGLLFPGTHEFRADPSVLSAVKLGRRLFGRIEQRNGQWWIFDVRLAGQ